MSAPSDLDLHGYTAAEAIEAFVKHYNERVKRNQLGCWKVIHGYGSTGVGGAIRTRLRAFLDLHPEKVHYEPGDRYGDPGWCFVYPKQHLPGQQERLATAILDFCTEGKTEEKIIREFVRHGEPQMKQTVRSSRSGTASPSSPVRK